MTDCPAEESAPRALVVGLGIAGISTAIALHQAGWSPVIVERSAERRRGGYFIGLFDMARKASRRLGYLYNMHNRQPEHGQTLNINRFGKGSPTVGFADAPAGVGPWMMLRGDVEKAGFEALPEDVEIRYSTQPTAIDQDADGATVTLENSVDGTTTDEHFDLVVGADGIRSTVRKLAFGPHEKFTHHLGYMICAYEMPEDFPELAEGNGAILTEPGQSFWVFPFRDNPSTVLFTFRTDDQDRDRHRDPVELIRDVFGPEPLGPLMERALDVLADADAYILDTADQIRIDRFYDGRVVLVGDSAWCPTLYSGMGATTAVGGADLLGQLLQKHRNDVSAALAEWQDVMRPCVDSIQKAGISGRRNFVAADEKELKKRTISVKVARTIVRNRALGGLLKLTKELRVRNGDLTDQI